MKPVNALVPMLRPANDDFKDGQLFARYLDKAAEGFFRFWLGRGVVDIVATAFQIGGG